MVSKVLRFDNNEVISNSGSGSDGKLIKKQEKSAKFKILRSVLLKFFIKSTYLKA